MHVEWKAYHITQQTFIVFQDVFSVNTFRLPRPLEDVFLKRLQDVLQDVFKTFSRRLEDVFARGLAIMSSRRLGRQKNVTEDVFSTSSPRRMFAECLHLLCSCNTEPETLTHFFRAVIFTMKTKTFS